MLKRDVSGVTEAANRAHVPAPAHMAPPLLSQEVSVDGDVLFPLCGNTRNPTDTVPSLKEYVIQLREMD